MTKMQPLQQHFKGYALVAVFLAADKVDNAAVCKACLGNGAIHGAVVPVSIYSHGLQPTLLCHSDTVAEKLTRYALALAVICHANSVERSIRNVCQPCALDFGVCLLGLGKKAHAAQYFSVLDRQLRCALCYVIFP